tara:strand:- start:248 stop:451 length:204 start_codon:yes stop_codon:yes gene_type:complete
MNTNIDKNNLKLWLSEHLTNKITRFDKVLELNEKIINYINSNNLKLSVPENIFLMQLTKYLYNNTNA